MTSMKLLKSYEVNKLCRLAGVNAACRSDGMQPVDVWYDPPETVMVSFALNENKALSMSFRGKLDTHNARIFLDSGATHNLIDKAYASSHILIVQNASASVQCAGICSMRRVN